MAETIKVQDLLNQIGKLERENAAHYKDDQRAAEQRLVQAQRQSRQTLRQERNFEIQQTQATNAKIASFRATRQNTFGNLQEARFENKLAQSRLSKKAAEILANKNLIRSRPLIEARERAQNQQAMESQVNSRVDQKINRILLLRKQTTEQRLATDVN